MNFVFTFCSSIRYHPASFVTFDDEAKDEEPVATKKRVVEKTAQLRVINEAKGQPALEISVPRGTNLKQSMLVVERLDAIIERLTGCPCMSGLEIRFREHLILDANPKLLEQQLKMG